MTFLGTGGSKICISEEIVVIKEMPEKHQAFLIFDAQRASGKTLRMVLVNSSTKPDIGLPFLI